MVPAMCLAKGLFFLALFGYIAGGTRNRPGIWKAPFASAHGRVQAAPNSGLGRGLGSQAHAATARDLSQGGARPGSSPTPSATSAQADRPRRPSPPAPPASTSRTPGPSGCPCRAAGSSPPATPTAARRMWRPRTRTAAPFLRWGPPWGRGQGWGRPSSRVPPPSPRRSSIPVLRRPSMVWSTPESGTHW